MLALGPPTKVVHFKLGRILLWVIVMTALLPIKIVIAHPVALTHCMGILNWTMQKVEVKEKEMEEQGEETKRKRRGGRKKKVRERKREREKEFQRIEN